MATITDFTGAVRTFPLATNIQVWVEQFQKYRAYRKTISELNALPNSELADLGLHRSGIKSIALESVYGIK